MFNLASGYGRYFDHWKMGVTLTIGKWVLYWSSGYGHYIDHKGKGFYTDSYIIYCIDIACNCSSESVTFNKNVYLIIIAVIVIVQ